MVLVKSQVLKKSYKNSKSYFSSSVDQSSGIVNLNFDHISPYYSKELLEKIYINLNAYLKELKLYEIDMKIKFLNKSYSEANIQDIKTNISKLLENEIEKKAILLSSENIYFDLIDTSSKGLRVAPKRSLIVLLISTISFISTILYFYFARCMKIVNNLKDKAVVFDRDGTLIHHEHYLYDYKKVKIFKDVSHVLKSLKNAVLLFLCTQINLLFPEVLQALMRLKSAIQNL